LIKNTRFQKKTEHSAYITQHLEHWYCIAVIFLCGFSICSSSIIRGLCVPLSVIIIFAIQQSWANTAYRPQSMWPIRTCVETICEYKLFKLETVSVRIVKCNVCVIQGEYQLK